jgi:hypothetical protein
MQAFFIEKNSIFSLYYAHYLHGLPRLGMSGSETEAIHSLLVVYALVGTVPAAPKQLEPPLTYEYHLCLSTENGISSLYKQIIIIFVKY